MLYHRGQVWLSRYGFEPEDFGLLGHLGVQFAGQFYHLELGALVREVVHKGTACQNYRASTDLASIDSSHPQPSRAIRIRTIGVTSLHLLFLQLRLLRLEICILKPVHFDDVVNVHLVILMFFPDGLPSLVDDVLADLHHLLLTGVQLQKVVVSLHLVVQRVKFEVDLFYSQLGEGDVFQVSVV